MRHGVGCHQPGAVLIQHNPNEGLKPSGAFNKLAMRNVLIQHNPNEGLKPGQGGWDMGGLNVLIQHNPNEGLKHERGTGRHQRAGSAHSAQPERGIETNRSRMSA